ncbi:MAG: T9SS type A sorting domain-containing protein [Saprospiraceae bacterium]
MIFIFPCSFIFSQIIYNADFSIEGDGFPDHTTSIPPAEGPQSVNGGSAPNNWEASYTTKPATDGSANEFSVNSGQMRIQDWGGSASWQSAAIDVSSVINLDITANGVTLGNTVQNVGSEFFNYFYILDGGSPVTTPIVLSGESAGTPVNYNITGLDVSMANSIVVGFSFNVNDADEGYLISSYTVTATALPVELIDFNARKYFNSIQLSWQTATEIDNDFFTVQHSLDGRTFHDLETIDGAGNSFESKSYSFVHKNPHNGMNYYRLKQTDFDGEESFSPVESIQFGENEYWSIYPNPAIDQLTISLPKTSDQNIAISIYDLQGKLHKQFYFTSELNQLELPLADLEQGQYFLKTIANNQVSTHLFFKK